jgi:16S rRNA (cytidine1402-2'-O)-methyltransferase
MSISKGKLYLLPVPLGENADPGMLSVNHPAIVGALKKFVVENPRTARRYIKKIVPETDLDQVEMISTNEEELSQAINWLMKGENVGLMSEAGLPCLADPGNSLVLMCHQKKIQVIALSGPSAVFIALMLSGLNGQEFTFHGYLPAKTYERKQKIKQLNEICYKSKQTQVFIETPYRNMALLKDLLINLNNDLYLSISSNIGLNDSFSLTLKIADWKKIPDDQLKSRLHKKPAVFCLGYI